jgi:CRISPR-associated protein Cas1
MASIYIVSDNGKLQKKGETLVLSGKDGVTTTIFPYKTEQLVVLGSVEITASALLVLMKHNIDTIFLGKNGRFNGKLVFQESKNVFLRKKQYDMLNSERFMVDFSKAIVAGKMKNQLTFMHRIARKNDSEIIHNAVKGVKTLGEKLQDADNVASVRGYEGMASRHFFSVFKYNIMQDWAVFNGRSMHPPADNVNAVLSFLYTLLFFRVDAAIEEEGLDSYVGYLHEPNYGRRSLSFDLMEEYRTPICDTLCCALFNLGILQKEDFEEVIFSTESDEYPLAEASIKGSETSAATDGFKQKKGVLLHKKGLGKVISQFEKKIDTQIYYQPAGKQISYKKAIREQIKHFRRVLSEEERYYQPLETK